MGEHQESSRNRQNCTPHHKFVNGIWYIESLRVAAEAMISADYRKIRYPAPDDKWVAAMKSVCAN